MIFGKRIKPLFYVLFRVSEKQELPFSQRLALIALFYIKGERINFKKYRLLSPTSTYYKIIAIVFVRKLLTIMEEIISKKQSAYIEDSFIEKNARLVLDDYDYCMENNRRDLYFLDFKRSLRFSRIES